MHPTVAETLQAVRRQLETDPLPPETLADIDRLLRRIEQSATARLPFLQADNEATATLLRELGAAVPNGTDGDEDAAHELNKARRGALCELIGRLEPGRAGDPARARIAAHLRHRVDADPSLNRQPMPYRTETP